MKYIPKLLNNIALDSGNKITQSIPLGHLGNFDSMFTPQRFVEQIVAFEYLFDKLEHKKSLKISNFTFKKELEYMFNEYPHCCRKQIFLQRKLVIKSRRSDVLLHMDMHITMTSKTIEAANI